MSQLEVIEERDSLSHAHIAIDFKTYIGYWSSWIYETHHVLRYYVQPWCLQIRQSITTMVEKYQIVYVDGDKVNYVNSY